MRPIFIRRRTSARFSAPQDIATFLRSRRAVTGMRAHSLPVRFTPVVVRHPVTLKQPLIVAAEQARVYDHAARHVADMGTPAAVT
jgi:hypothetical protein